MELKADGISRIFFRNGKNTNFFHAVNKTDFSLGSGKITVIIGKSGSGKTTFINMLAGLLCPTEGKVLLDGQDLYEMDDAKRSRLRNVSFGIIPQGHTGLSSLTVLENVLAPVYMYESGKSKKKKALDLLKFLGIDELQEVYSDELSGGEQRRMSIARALINDPEIVIADEPTGDLDDETTVKVLDLLKKYAINGAAVLIVTHDDIAVKYADYLYKMDNGNLINARPDT